MIERLQHLLVMLLPRFVAVWWWNTKPIPPSSWDPHVLGGRVHWGRSSRGMCYGSPSRESGGDAESHPKPVEKSDSLGGRMQGNGRNPTS